MVGEVERETPRERLRFSESKVYKRKSLKANKNSNSSSALEGSEKGNIISGSKPNFATSDEAVQEVYGDSCADYAGMGNNDSKNQSESATLVAVPDERHRKSNDTADDADLQHVKNVEVGSEAQKNEEVTKVGSDGGIEEQNARREKRQKLTHDKVELRLKRESELVLVRDLMKKIDDKQRELRRVTSDMQPKAKPMLNVSIINNHQAVVEGMEKEKEKRTPKANQFYRNSEFLLAKDKFPPAENNKAKYNGKKHGGDSNVGFGSSTKIFKRCSGLLERLMKNKHGWVFNAPVDADGLGLHDYHTIIKHPMDLGTIKSMLTKNCYKAPDEFAKDVRLTFHNAMTYNPKGQDVHAMAEQLLNIFEEKWEAIKMEHDRETRFSTMGHAGYSTPQLRKAPPLPESKRILSRSASIPISMPSGRISAPKKPKAKDENKRDMTYEEKQKLSTNLQGLPYEKLDNIVQIIKKRNSTVSHQDDEIEVDIDSVDPETLWELDRFVTNYKKSLSKNKRRAELAKQARAAAESKALQGPANEAESSPKQVLRNEDELRDKSSSSSSSSSSDSGSSSSDSDSDSSSASGSEVGDL